PGGDDRDRVEPADRLGSRRAAELAVPELTFGARAPADDVLVRAERAGVSASGGDLDGVVDARHLDGELRRRRAAPELTLVALAPAVDLAAGPHGTRVVVAGRDVDRIIEEARAERGAPLLERGLVRATPRARRGQDEQRGDDEDER